MTFEMMRKIISTMPKGSKANFARYLVRAGICNSQGTALFDIRFLKDNEGNCRTWIRRQHILNAFCRWGIQSNKDRRLVISDDINRRLNEYWGIK